MNKLLLTAYGFSTPTIANAAQNMIRENEVTKACIISTFWPKEKDKHPQMQQIRNDLINMNVPQVDFLDIEFKNANKLFDYNLIFLNGGYPFYLLHFIKKSGADRILKKIHQNGGLIFGLSAGSMTLSFLSVNVTANMEDKPKRSNLRLLSYFVLIFIIGSLFFMVTMPRHILLALLCGAVIAVVVSGLLIYENQYRYRNN
ncbi:MULTISPECIES: Type 1 glutamine amidotransferase-like domain-containing protein [Leuconostoc]|uniref:Type 1 glutamine amidotransferase-like domain-containing protein n=1 Tax=Leuconostoc TaxID=1243 RepID=UPI0002174E47|nr:MULTISPECIES: Type 1 glutamine amidotransferase-like domain-containing protein [Leuconostoc]AEJ30511.1 peptidase E [Leuconostoc sp. C2]